MAGGRVAIIGGGFSGAMLAARLAEDGVASTLIDRTGDFGKGVAYSTPFEGHVLNVRSGRMSAIETGPDDFVLWLEANRPDLADPEGFAPRPLYGAYLQERLTTVRQAFPDRIRLVVGEAAAIDSGAVRLADGQTIDAEAVVLATGNPAPATAPHGIGRVIRNPWAAGALDRIRPGDEVLIVGSGLTMVDMALWLEAHGRGRRIQVVSRHGLTPRGHGAHHDAPIPPTSALLEGPLSQRLAEARRLAARENWRGVMEGLRPITADRWRAADMSTRRRWLRHLRPWWDVHRHRIAQAVREAIEAMEATGRLSTRAGRVDSFRADGDRVNVAWRPRDRSNQQPITVDWVIDCTGPGHDAARTPLTRSLIEAGRARLDPTGLGLEVDAAGRVLSDSGADDRLLVLGPPSRAACWETIAVPDIRKAVETLTARLSGQMKASR